VPKRKNREERAEMKHEAWDLRLRGRSYREISVALNVSHVTVQRWVQEVMNEKSLPLASEIRKQELDRLTRYLDVLDHKIECGDIQAVALAVKVSESIRKMLGADLPVTANAVVDQATHAELEIMTLIQQVQARNQQTLERIAGHPVAAIEGTVVSEAEVID
jgi:transposase